MTCANHILRRSPCTRLETDTGTPNLPALSAAGGATIVSTLLNWRSDSIVHYSVFLFLFIAAATLKCRVPGVTGTYSPVFFFALLGAATLYSEQSTAHSYISKAKPRTDPCRCPVRSGSTDRYCSGSRRRPASNRYDSTICHRVVCAGRHPCLRTDD